MYVLIEKGTDNVSVFREKKYLSEEINVSVDTIRRKESLKKWEWGEYVIFNPIKEQLKTKRGGKRANNRLQNY